MQDEPPLAADSSANLRSVSPGASTAVRVVVVTTAMLTFIGAWRAAAVVLSDLASTAYYIGGIAEHAIGKAAPWFILAVMLFSSCVRAVYVESCSLFVRGGVYRIVREAMGSIMARIAVSALVFDFILTGPISAVSAGHYIHGLVNSLLIQAGLTFPVEARIFAVFFALAVTVYFWWLNIKGIEESSDKALKIMVVTGVMVVVLVIWGSLTIYLRGARLPPFEITMAPHAWGWLQAVPWLQSFTLVAVVVGFGHSLLAMSGEETLAQVYREIEAPKHRNLIKAAIIILVFSVVFTGFSSFAAVMLIPDEARRAAGDDLLNALIMYLAGPTGLKLLMNAFVVGVGGLILSGAVNTSLIGSNGVLNRVAEDGVLADWFRQPHQRFGTTHRIINLVAIMQVVTIVASGGRVTLLGEAYAFGVVWSFAFMSTAMFILRFKNKGERAFKVPINPVIFGKEIPVGLGLITAVLVAAAVANLLTKEIATISGIAFTSAFFTLFAVSEWWNNRKRALAAVEHSHREKFILERRTELTAEDLELPDTKTRILVPVRDPNSLVHLRAVLEEANARGTELVVMTIKVEKGESVFANLFTSDEELLFTRVVELAEKYGESLAPIVVPSNNSWFAIARTAWELNCAEIVMGRSVQIPADIQFAQLAMMWGMVGVGDRPIRFRIIGPDGQEESAEL